MVITMMLVCCFFLQMLFLPLLNLQYWGGVATSSSSPQRPDPLATDYGTIDDLCELCIGYGAMSVIESICFQQECHQQFHGMWQ